jgi:glycosyltransferase involved in cell wall biosynthesis
VTVPWLAHTGVAYRAMDVLAFPSYREGLPNVPIEAQLCGVPVVAFEATGTVDAIADGVGGVLVPVGDADAFGAAVADLIDDPERRRELGAAGSEWVAANFDQRALWDGLVDRYRLWSRA